MEFVCIKPVDRVNREGSAKRALVDPPPPVGRLVLYLVAAVLFFILNFIYPVRRTPDMGSTGYGEPL